ncbi:MAG: VCBS repeat-containing protein [Myxococcales bacterium]|nr:VCBS repeat-containing protein [Myxococcales bacterium]
MRGKSLAFSVLVLASCERNALRRTAPPPIEPRPATTATTATTARPYVPGDLDGDGTADALVALGPLGVQVFRGDARGLSPGASIGAAVDDTARIVATAIAIGRHGANSVALVGERLANTPSDTWRCARGRIRVFVFESGRRRELASLEPPVGFAQLGRAIERVGDLDRNGYDDFLALGSIAREGFRRVPTGTGLSTERRIELCGEPALFLIRGGPTPALAHIDIARTSEQATLAHFDGASAQTRDSYPDLATFHQQLLVYRGTATGFTREPIAIAPERSDAVGSPVGIASGDFDRDGHNDVVVAFSASTGEIARVYFGPLGEPGGESDGGLSVRTLALTVPADDAGAATGTTRGLIVADFDGDRIDDVLLGDPGANRLLLFRGGASMTPSISPSILRGPEASDAQFGAHLAQVGDLDGDQSPEILAPVFMRTERGTIGNAWLLSPRAPSNRGRAIAPPTADENFAHAVASATSATRGAALSVPPIPRRCAVSDATSLVTISVAPNTIASGVITTSTRNLVAPPTAAIAAIEATLAPARAAVARCHARWLESDCNHAATLSLPFSTQRDGTLSPEGANSAAGIDAEATLDCVRDAINPGRIAPAPRGRAFGIVVTVRLAPAP